MNYTRQVNESEDEFIYRVCKDKIIIGSWQEVADIINRELSLEFTESKYRKQFQSYCKIAEKIKPQDNKELLDEIEEKKNELFKQQVKTADRLREFKNELRYEARYENLVDAVRECAEKMPSFSLDRNISYSGQNEAILTISDWHFGALVNNFKQKFNIEILTKKVAQLKNSVIKYCKTNDVKKLNVLNLGDMIHGNIHVSARIESEVDTISQVIMCSELLGNFLHDLGMEIEEVVYRSVLDNHSRINKKYDEHIESENFGRLSDWYLQTRLKKSNVQIMQDNLDDNIGYFQTEQGKNVFFVHGHLDNISTILQSLTFGTDIIADYCFVGHWHTSKMKEYQGKKVFLNGSLLGTDSYALNHRLFAKPSQTLVVFDGNDEIDIRINL